MSEAQGGGLFRDQFKVQGFFIPAEHDSSSGVRASAVTVETITERSIYSWITSV